jgi:hypothetical protein
MSGSWFVAAVLDRFTVNIDNVAGVLTLTPK